MLFQFQFSKNKNPTTNDLLDHIKEKNLDISEKLLRYHLKRLTDFGLIERRNLKYFFCSDPKADKNNVRAGYQHAIASHVGETLSNVGDALGRLAESYSK
jgi:repressor of nif and glnA expression